jgi:hypothetical protein
VVSRCYLLTCPIVPKKTVMDVNKVEDDVADSVKFPVI